MRVSGKLSLWVYMWVCEEGEKRLPICGVVHKVNGSNSCEVGGWLFFRGQEAVQWELSLVK